VRMASSAIVGILALVVYVRTLLPGMAFGDWGEMQTVPHVLGIAHPTGYPTYILLAWLAQLAPIGSIALRANVLSALFVSGALAATVAILQRLGIRAVIAVPFALALGAVGTVWSVATVAEVNPLHLLFVALLIHRALVWDADRRPRDLLIGAFLVGLALGNHLLTLFVAPFIAVFVLWVGRREIARRPWLIGAAAAATILGLGVYLYIPLAAAASPPLAYNHPVTFDAFVWLVTGTQFRGQFEFLTPGGPAALVSYLPSLWSTATSRATVVLPIIGLGGLPILVRQRPAFGLTCAAILLVNLYIWANYLRLEHYLLAAWLVLTISAAIGVEAVARRLDGWLPMQAGGRLLGAAAAVFAVVLVVTNWTGADRSRDVSAQAYVDALFDALPEHAAVLSVWDASTPLWHAQLVLDGRPDVLVVDDTDIVYGGWGTRERRIASLICERPVFILRLKESELGQTRAAYRLEPFIDVRIAFGGPSAVVSRTVYRVEPQASACV
jgi:transmembrane protein TMEM260 (protein O-mannosyltransferase)